ANKPVSEWPLDHPFYQEPLTDKTVSEAWERFREYISAYGPFYRDFHRLWQDKLAPHIWDRCEKRFLELYKAPKNAERLRCLWRHAMWVHQTFFNLVKSDSLAGVSTDIDELNKEIENCLREGRAFQRL